jgi:hypothetical protein
MKSLIILTLVSSFAMAAFNDFECDFRTRSGKAVSVEVESSFGSSISRRLNMSVVDNGTITQKIYWTTARYNRAFNEIEYYGAGTRLRIDMWPDQRPVWGRSYRAEFTSWDLEDSTSYFNTRCRYTGRR